jgi:hypothetical protein
MVHVLKIHMIKFLMQLYALRNICFLYIITFFDSLLKGLQEFPTLKQFVSLNIGLKYIISDYNHGHIIWELRTWVQPLQIMCVFNNFHLTFNFKSKVSCDFFKY